MSPGETARVYAEVNILKGEKRQRFGDVGLIELIKSNNFQQRSYF